MNGVERFPACHAGSFQKEFRHLFPVSFGKSLTDNHIMQIIFQISSAQITKVLRHRGLRLVHLKMKLL